MAPTDDHELPRYRLPQEAGDEDPLPRELDTVRGWHARARLVRPDARPVGTVRIDGQWVPVYAVNATVPIESDADPDATSAYPRASRVPGVYDYPTSRGPGEGE
jgi:hypothetical protein